MDNKVKQVLAPSIYSRFQCKGTNCRYNCCQKWRIALSKSEYREWKKCGILPKGKTDGSEVHLCPEHIRTERIYAEITLDKNGRCPYLTEEGLCQIQKQYGVKRMSATCRIFPREAHKFFDHVECSFSLGCEKVLELLLEEKDGLLLNVIKPQSFEVYGSDYNLSDRRKYPKLNYYYDIQTLSLALLQTEDISIENRLLILGMAVDQIETLYSQKKSEDIKPYIEEFVFSLQNTKPENILDTIPDERPLAVFNSVLSALMVLDFPDSFRSDVILKLGKATKAKKETENPELEYYQECRRNFSQWIKEKEYFLENVMVMCLLWLNIPFRDLKKSLWDNYLYLVWIWIMLKGYLCLYLTDDSTDEDMIDCCTILFRSLGHNKNHFEKILETYQAEGNTLGHVALLLRSC